MSVYDDGADVGGEAVRAREGGDGDEGYAHVEGVVARKVHERAAADGDDDVGVLKLGDDGLNEALLGVQALSLEDYLLVRRDVDHAGEVVGIGVVEHGTAPGESALGHVVVKVLEGAVLDDDHLCLERVLPPAGAGAGIFCAI